MNKEIRQILENQNAIMRALDLYGKNELFEKVKKTNELLNDEYFKELPTEMPEEDEE